MKNNKSRLKDKPKTDAKRSNMGIEPKDKVKKMPDEYDIISKPGGNQ